MQRFSVIIPLYNKAPYVAKTIESVLSQSFTDYELIIVDDGSSDHSADIAFQIISGHRNCQLIRQENAGVSMARNKGVAASHGDYLCFLDADDWWEPTFLEEMDKQIDSYPDAGLYATNYVYYKPGKTHVALNMKTGYITYPQAYLECVAMPVWTGAACMPRKVFDEMGGFLVGIKLGEDFLLWAKTALHYPVAFCEKPLAYYNNDVPASMRATRNLHAPQHHMLFNLQPIEDDINHLQLTSNQLVDWKRLLDRLRVNGLIQYWLDNRYHAVAEEELKKVNWNIQPSKVTRPYKLPIWFLKTLRWLVEIGSACKQKFNK